MVNCQSVISNEKYSHHLEVEDNIGDFDTEQFFISLNLTLHQQKYIMKWI